MTIKRRVIKGSSIWPAEDIERFYTRQEVINKARDHAAQLWKLLVEKLGIRLAKEIMHEIMGDKKPDPRRIDERKALIDFIRRNIQSSDSNQSNEQIAKRIFESEPHYLHNVRDEIFTIDELRDMIKGIFKNEQHYLHDDDLRDALRDEPTIDVVSKKSIETTLAKNPNAMGRSVGKGLAALEKQVGRIRREMVEEGSLPKAYAPKPYRRG